jgi:putative membrane protein
MREVYCGPAPTPENLWIWNADPAVIGLVIALVVAYGVWGVEGRRTALAGAIALLLVLFVSPLCALTAALFSARAIHHVILVAAAAPLLAFAFRLGDRLPRVSLGLVVAGHAVVFWFWHLPGVYAEAIVQPLPYWSMQLTLLGSATWLWARVFDPQEGAGSVLSALLATIVQMGMLGALLTFAARPLYELHLTTTLPYGLTPLADQQLAGLVMWVPAALPYLLAALLLVARRFDRTDDAAGAARAAR